MSHVQVIKHRAWQEPERTWKLSLGPYFHVHARHVFPAASSERCSTAARGLIDTPKRHYSAFKELNDFCQTALLQVVVLQDPPNQLSPGPHSHSALPHQEQVRHDVAEELSVINKELGQIESYDGPAAAT
jgi:hypothetical protein